MLRQNAEIVIIFLVHFENDMVFAFIFIIIIILFVKKDILK